MARVWDGEVFTCDSTGNGAAVTLTEKATGRSVFFQGDDAVMFGEERDALEAEHPTWPGDAIYAALADIYVDVMEVEL